MGIRLAVTRTQTVYYELNVDTVDEAEAVVKKINDEDVDYNEMELSGTLEIVGESDHENLTDWRVV